MMAMPTAPASGPILFGAAYSVYVRAVRLVLAEKQVPYELVEVDIFASGGPPAGYTGRHPFNRIPAFEDRGLRLYESTAIERYVDEAFPGPALQPQDVVARARMNQAISVLDGYCYRTLVWDLFVPLVRASQQGRVADLSAVPDAWVRASTCLGALAEIQGGQTFLASSQLTLADLHAVPMFAYFLMVPGAPALLRSHPGLARWWEAMAARPSVALTRSPYEAAD